MMIEKLTEREELMAQGTLNVSDALNNVVIAYGADLTYAYVLGMLTGITRWLDAYEPLAGQSDQVSLMRGLFISSPRSGQVYVARSSRSSRNATMTLSCRPPLNLTRTIAAINRIGRVG
jgi:hypothetical protein